LPEEIFVFQEKCGLESDSKMAGIESAKRIYVTRVLKLTTSFLDLTFLLINPLQQQYKSKTKKKKKSFI
jgi:hypothetical protein